VLAPVQVGRADSLDTCPSGAQLDAVITGPVAPPPARTAQAGLQNPNKPLLELMFGRPVPDAPADGRPPGEGWAHQRYEEFPPQVYFQSAQSGARVNSGVRDSFQRHGYALGEFGPGGLYHNTVGAPGFDGTTASIPPKSHPNFPAQDPRALWTFDGSFPAKLLQARLGEAVLLRHHNALPVDPAANMGFGAHTITTHLHNGHNPAESDGYMHAFFFPGQYYDFRWPMILAGYDSINTGATDPRAGRPDGSGGIVRVRGDFRETQSSLWFHDHMLDHTSENVYKGNAALMNIYSALDRGNEAIDDGVNLRLPSGTGLDWGNRDYDVNLLVADKAWDSNGQLWFNPFETGGFLGDTMTVNWQYAPYFDVRARRYRLRLLNGCVGRYLKLGLMRANGEPVVFHLIANDGDIMEHAVAFDGSKGTDRGALPAQAIAERWDIVVDFAQFQPGERIYLVNLLEHTTGEKPNDVIPLSSVASGSYLASTRDDDSDGLADRWIDGDPCVGRIMEFRVQSYAGQDLSMNPALYTEGGLKMVPLHRPSAEELATAKHHSFVFGRSGGTDVHPWTIKTNDGDGLDADYTLVSVAPQLGELQVWKFKSGGGWAHPVHVHFEEAITLSRDGVLPPIWERWARKDVWKVGAGPDSTSEVEVAIRLREFAGSYVEHCHNTTHEDLAMLLRFDIEQPGQVAPLPSPVPTWEGCLSVPSTSLPQARTGDRLGAEDPVANSAAWAAAQGGGTTGGTTGGGTTTPPPPPPPPAITYAIDRAEYRVSKREWRIEGELSNTGAGVTVQIYLGGSLSGTLIGTTTTDSDGEFELRKVNPPKGTFTTISLQASNGAVLLNRTFSNN
jgi:FtsP/CotA-like multicopper oxidase with cupredoxin domain